MKKIPWYIYIWAWLELFGPALAWVLARWLAFVAFAVMMAQALRQVDAPLWVKIVFALGMTALCAVLLIRQFGDKKR